MENFLIDDRFYSEIEDLIDDVLDWEGVDELDQLDDDWSIQACETELEPMYKISLNQIWNMLDSDRLPENSDFVETQLDKLLQKYINFDAINEGMPKLYYPKRKGEFTITKKDLLCFG